MNSIVLEGRIKELEEEISRLKSSKESPDNSNAEMPAESHSIIQSDHSGNILTAVNEKFSNLADNTFGHIAFVDAKSLKYEFVNMLYEISFGIPREKIIGSEVKDIIGEANYQYALPYINEARAGRSVSYENVFYLKSEKHWLQVNFSPVFDKDNDVISIAVLTHDITERKLSEKKLDESEENLRKIIETTSEGYWLMDDRGSFLDVNSAYCSLLGYTKEEVLKMSVSDIEAMETKIETEIHIKKVSQEGNDRFDTILRRKDGSLVNAEINVSKFGKEGNKFFVFVHDISERKKAEETLKKSEVLLKSSIESQKDTILLSVDHNCKYLYFNKAHSDTMKALYKREIKVGMNILDYITSEVDKNNFKKHFEHALEGESVTDINLHGDIKREYFETFFNPIRNDQDEIFGITVLSRNIAKRKQSEEAITQQNDALSSLNRFALELSNLSFEDNLEEFIARKVKEMSGAEVAIFSEYDRDNKTTITKCIELEPGLLKNVVGLLGKKVQNIHSPINDEMYKEMTGDIVGTRKTLYEASFGAVPKAVSSSIQALLNVDRFLGLAYLIEGKLYGTSLLGMKKNQPDPPKIILENFIHLAASALQRNQIEKQLKIKIDELQNTNKRLEQFAHANEELEQFAFIASHNLQQPLRTVSNYIQIFEEDYSDKFDNKAFNYLKIVKDSVSRMSILLNSLLDFSRLGRNLKLTRTDCKALIDNVIADLETLTVTTNTTIEVGAMPVLDIYQSEFSQLIQNLIMNAIKFQKTGNLPNIKIRAENLKSKWKFSVSDNGIGIAPRYFEKIFDIFQRLHNDSEYQGSGIGLAFCKKIVQLHKGEIWVESTEGKGTVFYFTIPVLE